MGGKSQPNYTQAAQQQGAANRETAIAQSLLNNPNIVTPYGAQTYTGPVDASGRATMTQTLSPAEQAKLNASNAIQLQSLGILGEDVPQIRSALLSPFGLAGGPTQGYLPGTDPGRAVTNANWSSAGPVQSSLDFGGLPGIPQASPYVRDLVSQSIYNQGARLLDPQFQQAQADLNSQLANQGIVANPAMGTGQPLSAWDRAQNNLALQRSSAYNDLANRAISGGGDAMSQLFGMQLGARQQGVGELTTQGQFANTAQQQAFNDILNAMQAQNAGIGLQGQLASNAAGLYNTGRQQAYTEMAQNRTMPLNMLNAMLTSSQVNNPQFQAMQPTAIAPPPIMQGAQLQGQAATAAQNATMGMIGSGLGAIGSVGAGFAMNPSAFGRMFGGGGIGGIPGGSVYAG